MSYRESVKKFSLRRIVIGFGIGAAFGLGAFFLLFLRERNMVTVQINNVSLVAEIARDDASRLKGLSGRDALDSKGGMLFAFRSAGHHAIWMKGMKFSIDIFWIRNGAGVDLEEKVSVPPPEMNAALLPIYRPDVPAEFALETVAGFAKKHGITIGSRVTFGESRVTPAAHRAAAAESSGFGADATTTSVQQSSAERASEAGEEFFIKTLREEVGRGSQFKIEKTLSRTGAYTKFLISYFSGHLKISGVMNVPAGTPPRSGWPVLILNHGLIHPSVYFSGRGSKREQDFFTRRGYVTIHPDYRGHASSDPNPAAHHDFYVGYTQDVTAAVDALKSFRSSLIDRGRIGMWGHSMGGGMAARVMAVRRDIRAFVLFAPISADVEDNFYELKKDEILWLRSRYGAEGADAYRKMSPLVYFKDVSAPVQLHHGTADKDVPIAFSQKMYDALAAHGKKAEFFIYQGEPHEFGEAWTLAAERAVQFFDTYVKGPL